MHGLQGMFRKSRPIYALLTLYVKELRCKSQKAISGFDYNTMDQAPYHDRPEKVSVEEDETRTKLLESLKRMSSHSVWSSFDFAGSKKFPIKRIPSPFATRSQFPNPPESGNDQRPAQIVIPERPRCRSRDEATTLIRMPLDSKAYSGLEHDKEERKTFWNSWDDSDFVHRTSYEPREMSLSEADDIISAQTELAIKELSRVLLYYKYLVDLYERAIGNPKIGAVRLQNWMCDLLKDFARDLETEAEEKLERLIAQSVFAKASYVTSCVVEKFEVKLLRPQPQFGRVETDDMSDDDEYHEDEDPIDEDLIDDLAAWRYFFTKGEAFTSFLLELTYLVRPEQDMSFMIEPAAENLSTDAQQRIESDTVGENIKEKTLGSLARLFIAMGYLEPPLRSGWVRVRWQCVSQAPDLTPIVYTNDMHRSVAIASSVT